MAKPMVKQRRNSRNDRGSSRRYRTDGSVAYQPEFEEEPSGAPSRPDYQAGRPARRPEQPRRTQTRPRRRPAVRPNIQVRPQTAVSPFAVVGVFAVLVCTLLLVMSTAQLAVANNEVVTLRSQLADLQDEGRMLQAKYELEFDLETIERQFLSTGEMVRPGMGQTVYLDLSAADSVVYYDGAGDGLSAVLQKAENFLANLLS